MNIRTVLAAALLFAVVVLIGAFGGLVAGMMHSGGMPKYCTYGPGAV